MNFYTRLPTILRAPDGGASPAPVVAPVPVIPPTAPPDDLAAFLRREAAESRVKATAAEKDAEAARAETMQAKKDAKAETETAIAAAKATTDRRIINAELRIEATKAGMVDLDGLKLLDQDKAGVALDDDGNVTGAAEAMEVLKKTKPFLFGAAKTGNPETPKPGDPKSKSALDMTPQELAVAKKELTRR
jgi:hypothetical protein